jgi:hypothetical protein
LRDLQSDHFPNGPTVAFLFHGLLNNVLHLFDGAVLSDEFPILVTPAAVGLAFASVSSCSAITGVFGKRYSAGLALLHGILAGLI